ncbi:MAG: hydroxyethylthiazole kinase [Pseudomonadota bacterium]
MTSPAEALTLLRAESPLVQCITNFVAMNLAANTLLAAGAAPAMVHAVEESEAFAGMADAATINIGTLSSDWIDGMYGAARGAQAAGRPWVLDPVAHFISPFRSHVTQALMGLKPDIIRGNASEILALAGRDNTGRGVNAGDAVAIAEDSAHSLAQTSGAVIAVTGTVDFVTDGTRAARISGGSDLMPKITAMGCSLTCLIGAFAAVSDNPFDATVAALAMFAAAGEAAADLADGPGSFAWMFLDALAAVEPEFIAEGRVHLL